MYPTWELRVLPRFLAEFKGSYFQGDRRGVEERNGAKERQVRERRKFVLCSRNKKR